jgi:hypothetical protein
MSECAKLAIDAMPAMPERVQSYFNHASVRYASKYLSGKNPTTSEIIRLEREASTNLE